MSSDKEKLDVLLGKIDELLSVLKSVSEDLKTISASMKSLAVSQIITKPDTTGRATIPSSPSKPAVPTVPAGLKSKSLEDIRMIFPEELDNMLSFDEKGDYVIIKPKQFLGSENFAKIASAVRGIGGEYISAGRESHFRVCKKP
jgi:hypothetical protein